MNMGWNDHLDPEADDLIDVLRCMLEANMLEGAQTRARTHT
jgi:hypothetical protein